MISRSTKARQVENQLQTTLLELQKSNDMCKRLIEESEREIISIVNKNTVLKKEIGELNSQLTTTLEERDNLNLMVSGFDKCSSEYEEVLLKCSYLKNQLKQAQSRIEELENIDLERVSSQTQCLYDELVGCTQSQVSVVDNCTNTDISLLKQTDYGYTCTQPVVSKNKIKKYVKINKLIRRTKKLIKKNNNNQKMASLCNEKKKLINKLNLFPIKLQNIRCRYETDIEQLQSELKYCHSSLENVTSKYQSAQNQIKEQILAPHTDTQHI